MKCGNKKIRIQHSPLLLFGALCGDRLQKEFDRCKARSCKKMPFLPFLIGQIVTLKRVRGLREQESAGTK